MALIFNKLFAGRASRKQQQQQQDTFSTAGCQPTVCDKLFSLASEQVRTVVFQECDFRGRKLLFDSDSIQRHPLQSAIPPEHGTQDVKYIEKRNGYGYSCTKPANIGPLGEMIFGSVAMSYRGTTYKIHSLSSPQRLICSQVFPSPKSTPRMRSSAPSHIHISSDSPNLEQSVRFDDSAASSGTSSSDHSAALSTQSDTLLVCKRLRSNPLDVPLNSSLVSSSGYGGGYSFNSFDSGPQSIPIELRQGNSQVFSSGSLNKRWLRSTSTSLDQSTNSLVCSVSTDESFPKTHGRSSKIGLAIVIEIPVGQEEKLEQFIMEHIALIDSLVWRTRRGIETAYVRRGSFISMMYDISVNTSKWLVDFLSGPRLSGNMWHSVAFNCDNFVSIKSKLCSEGTSDDPEVASECLVLDHSTSSGDWTITRNGTSEYSFLSLSKFLRTDALVGKVSAGSVSLADQFLKDFCDLIESADAKHTNFFISTLITAVLTHHLGWVTTTTPAEHSTETLSKLQSCNPLWGQLTDLYGAVGHPTKIAHTIVTGNKPELIAKILNTLTYFIRCANIEKRVPRRGDIEHENSEVDLICQESSCLPKENYKKYEDHLNEMRTMLSNGSLNARKLSVKPLEFEDLHKANNHSKEMNGLSCNGMQSERLGDRSKNFQNHSSLNELKPSMNKKSTLSRTHTCLTKLVNMDNLDKPQEGFKDINDNNEDVVFVLGDNEKLVGLKQNLNKYAQRESGENDYAKQSVIQNKQRKLNIANLKVGKNFHVETNTDENVAESILLGTENPNFTNHTAHEVRQEESISTCRLITERTNCLKTEENFCNTKIPNGECTTLETSSVNKHTTGDVDDTTIYSKQAIAKNKTIVKRPSTLAIPNPTFFCNSSDSSPEESTDPFKDEDFYEYTCAKIKPSTSAASLITEPCSSKTLRAQSEPPTVVTKTEENENGAVSKHRYIGHKFDFNRYPNIVKNYMRSKNIELSDMQFSEKQLHFKNAFEQTLAFPAFEEHYEEVETLQTPSNASELEFTSDSMDDGAGGEQVQLRPQQEQHTAKIKVETQPKAPEFVRKLAANTIIREIDDRGIYEKEHSILKTVELPMPRTLQSFLPAESSIDYTKTLLRGVGDNYMANVVLQGTTAPKSVWEPMLKRDLVLASRHPLLDQPVDEAIAIIANTDTWEVQLMSSHTYVIDKNHSGVTVGMSQLVANMIESLVHMWRLHTPAEYCLMHIEQRLQEFCARSRALSDMLLSTEFASMDLLTGSLQLEVNDVPLLMAIASTHSPLLAQRYGLSFQ